MWDACQPSSWRTPGSEACDKRAGGWNVSYRHPSPTDGFLQTWANFQRAWVQLLPGRNWLTLVWEVSGKESLDSCRQPGSLLLASKPAPLCSNPCPFPSGGHGGVKGEEVFQPVPHIFPSSAKALLQTPETPHYYNLFLHSICWHSGTQNWIMDESPSFVHDMLLSLVWPPIASLGFLFLLFNVIRTEKPSLKTKARSMTETYSLLCVPHPTCVFTHWSPVPEHTRLEASAVPLTISEPPQGSWVRGGGAGLCGSNQPDQTGFPSHGRRRVAGVVHPEISIHLCLWWTQESPPQVC